MISGVETYHRTYAGGYSIAFLMYGGMQSWNNNGTESWTWENPGLSTFDPELLEEVPMRPLGTPQASPHAFAVPSATKAVWMPSAIIEDSEAAAAEEGEGITIEGILWGLIPGSSLVDGYEDYQKGNYVSAAFNGAMGLIDLVTMGAVSKTKAIVKSGGRAIYGMLDSTLKGLKGLVEEGVQLASGKLDDGGKLLFAAYVPKSLKDADKGMIELARARNTLRQNLGENPFPVSAEAHHILPVERWNSKAAEKLRKWKIDLNGKDNGVWLPKVHYEGRTATLHKMHTRDYGDMVVRLLMQAKNRKEGKQVLLKIKQGLLDGTIQL